MILERANAGQHRSLTAIDSFLRGVKYLKRGSTLKSPPTLIGLRSGPRRHTHVSKKSKAYVFSPYSPTCRSPSPEPTAYNMSNEEDPTDQQNINNDTEGYAPNYTRQGI